MVIQLARVDVAGRVTARPVPADALDAWHRPQLGRHQAGDAVHLGQRRALRGLEVQQQVEVAGGGDQRSPGPLRNGSQRCDEHHPDRAPHEGPGQRKAGHQTGDPPREPVHGRGVPGRRLAVPHHHQEQRRRDEQGDDGRHGDGHDEGDRQGPGPGLATGSRASSGVRAMAPTSRVTTAVPWLCPTASATSSRALSPPRQKRLDAAGGRPPRRRPLRRSRGQRADQAGERHGGEGHVAQIQQVQRRDRRERDAGADDQGGLHDQKSSIAATSAASPSAPESPTVWRALSRKDAGR